MQTDQVRLTSLLHPSGPVDAGGEVLQCDVQHQTHVSDGSVCQILEYRDQVGKLVVVCIGEPRADGHSVLRVEDVARWRVVDDDRLFEGSSDLGQVFHAVALVIVARFAEES